MQGRFVNKQPHEMEPGKYGFRWVDDSAGGVHPGERRKSWYACTPNGLLGNLDNHDVTEHEDGTITVSPSILVNKDREPSWHGYLERGVWREV